MARTHEKFGGCSLSSRPFTCLMTDHTTVQIEVVRKSLGGELQTYSITGITVFTQQYICIWVYICKTSQRLQSEYLSFSCLYLRIQLRKFFFHRTHGQEV